jgi:ABC-type Mn2+/Zn2+ transport system ATPase subunit
MYECLTKNPDLVVLDDPISSFDKNKKFAILEMLFRGQESLQGKTVLMLTHDIEPIIDLIKNLNHAFVPKPDLNDVKKMYENNPYSLGVVTPHGSTSGLPSGLRLHR